MGFLNHKVFTKYISKNYIFYGSSILVARGAEYLVLLLAAGLVSKEIYGELEFYKKIIEVFSMLLAFGFPPLILSYTRSRNSKIYFLVLALIFVVALSILFSLALIPFEYSFLVLPLLFHAIFFHNGFLPVFVLVNYNSRYASIYKITVSVFFYAIILLLYYFDYFEYSFVIVNYILFPFFGIALFLLIRSYKIDFRKLRHYWKLFRKLLISTLTLVTSTFCNRIFLYSDIFIISILSMNANKEMAEYSFPLNIANALLLIPFTIIQVDIEKIKKDHKMTKITQNKVFKLTILSALLLCGVFFILIFTTHKEYQNTIFVFLCILVAKIFQAITVLLGTKIMIYKLYQKNLVYGHLLWVV